jgi:hypothetical protein
MKFHLNLKAHSGTIFTPHTKIASVCEIAFFVAQNVWLANLPSSQSVLHFSVIAQ